MAMSRRRLMQQAFAASVGLAMADFGRAWGDGSTGANDDPAKNPPFKPTWDSLSRYQCPDWFADAKFGIWAHWSAQCVPEQGDWYARKMYIQGDHDYDYQCQHYGHPSKVGFKDIDHIWHAENWNPRELIDLYKKAGAKYFFALANHHDNFDCYDSQYHAWNSTRIGPMKDIVGTWAPIAREAGLRFGTSVHASHAWSFFEPAQGADSYGPLKGVPYDGKLTAADGKGAWWDGLDPQQLYCQNHKPGTALQWEWDASKGSSVPDAAYCRQFYNRTIDLIDKYNPDLIYFDDTVLPLWPISDVGLKLAAHYYNSNIRKNGGMLDAVLFGKWLNDQQRKCLVQDFERSQSNSVEPTPWQSDTCIGQWHYSRALFENKAYKTPAEVVHILVDVVSKNGNLLLSIPVRGDGTIDSEERKFLAGFTGWMSLNGEAIFATRPWKIAGEGPTSSEGAGRSKEARTRYTARDLRFTTRGNTLFAIALGWPSDGKLRITTLAAGARGIVGDVQRVSLLGEPDPLQFDRTADGLSVALPERKPCDYAYVLKIEGLDPARSAPVAHS